jgi:predicted amidophosphoribosyltransferase
MQVALRQIFGPWDLGWVLAKHTLHSTYLGDDEYGRPRFDTVRSEVGEAIYQLKYRQDWSKVAPLAEMLREHVLPRLAGVGFIVPMPASRARARQPVSEIALELGRLIGVPVFTELLTQGGGKSLKDMHGKDEKMAALKDRIGVADAITNQGRWNVLLVDDLFDSGASMETAAQALRTYGKVQRVYVTALTWK